MYKMLGSKRRKLGNKGYLPVIRDFFERVVVAVAGWLLLLPAVSGDCEQWV